MRLTVNEILKESGARLPAGSPDTEVEGAGVDSRAPAAGSLFVGVRGEVTDGGQYAADALRAGAAAAVVRESAWRWIEGEAMGLRKPVIVADDPLAVLQVAGRLALARTGARVVGVTGATGKTTTKDILIALLRAAGVRAEGTPGNLNTEVGVPMSLMALPEDAEVAVVEMGMRGPGQIAALARLAPPVVGCITAIGPVHLELLGTVEAVAASKAEVLQALPPGGTAVVPAGEALLAAHLDTLDPDVRVVRFQVGDADHLDLGLSKSWERANAAAALACARALGAEPPAGVPIPVALSGLRGQERPVPGGGVLIEDCYNANPLAMEAALVDLAGRPARRVAVLGDMMELGPDEARYHAEAGARAAELGLDLLVAVGERASWYAEAAEGIDVTWFPTVADAVAGVGELVRDGDVVLVKGSRSLALERVAEALTAR